jgi:hypothetical protein
MTVRTELSAVGFRLRHRLWLFILLVVFCSGTYAAQPIGGGLDVAVSDRSTHAALRGVYVALIALDQPAHRPTVEAIVDGAVKWEGIPPGRYVMISEAPSYHLAMRNVEIGNSRNSQASLELLPEFELTGSVVDAAGRPVKGATVSHPRVVPPTLLGVMSDLARQTVRLRTTTDENGWWKLGVPVKDLSLLVEAPGYEAAWVSWDPKKSEMPPVTLRRGSSLRVLTNRPAPDLLLTLVPSAHIETSVPVEWRDRVWAREAQTTSVEWTSMPAGQYDLVATWPDPRRFTAPVTLRHVTLSGNGNEGIKVSLPDAPPLAAKDVRIRVPFKTDVRGLRAFMRTANGSTEVPAASENVTGGRVLYANADAASDVYFTTEGEVILGLLRAKTAENQEQGPAAEGIKFPRAEGTLRVSVPEKAPLPSHGNARFDECEGDKSFVLPVNVRKSGDIALPVLVGCRALLLRFESFSPVVVRSTAHAREEVWLGTHRLKGAASVQVHVVHKTDGTNVPEAMVTASVERGSGEFLAVAKGTARADGWLTMEGLPVGETITFQAQDSTKLAGTVTRTLEPGRRDIIDPLPLPEAGSITVIPRFEDSFKNENANAEIIAVILQPEKGGNTDLRSVELNSNHQEAVFSGVTPGSWHLIAVVRLDSLSQPIDVTTLKIESGDKKKLEPVIEPLVVSGHITSHSRGLSASIAFTDPPGPGAIVRRVMSHEDGAFKTLLPRPGYYAVAARRRPPDADTQLAPMQFDHASRDVRIELPEGSLSVRVFSGDRPESEVQITATMLGDSSEQNQLLRLERRARTDSIGEVTIGELQDGMWLVKARGKDEAVAEKTVTIDAATPASLTLHLDDGSTLEGSVIDGAGNPAGMAWVDCIYTGSDNIPRTGYAAADSWGKFSIHFPKPAPERLRCGVTAADGAIGTFITAPVSDANLTLPSATAAVTFTNWSDRGNKDRFWLLAPDGGLFDLSWAALKFRKLDGPFTIPRVPAGAWSVVRIDSAGALFALAGGGAAALPRVAQVRLAAGESQEISMKSGDTSAPR